MSDNFSYIEKRTTEPTSTLVEGRVYYNTLSRKLFYCDGKKWEELITDSGTFNPYFDMLIQLDNLLIVQLFTEELLTVKEKYI